MTAAISIQGLTKDYGSLRALDDLTLDVQAGEIFGFLGPNGAGKTTTIRMLLDLIRPTAGSAVILGHNCQTESHLVGDQTTYLPGELNLYPNRTGWEIVELIAGLRGRPADRRYIESLADVLNLDLTRKTGTLSKGNRQKVGIILAFFSRPGVFLLDEPTSGLDPINQRAVWDLIRQKADRGATVFFSSHVMSEVEEICKRVAILRGGRLVAVEPIADLKARALRRLEITFAEPVPRNAFAFDGVRELDRQGTTVRLEVSGELDRVIKTAAQHRVVTLKSEQASLDDILLTFYQEPGP